MTYLPKQKTKKKTSMQEMSIMVYGPAKIGKTTTCSRAEGALFIPTEPGLNNVEVFATPQPESWEHFLAIAKEVATTKEYKTIIIDVFDNLYRLCADDYCKKTGVPHEADVPFGKAAPAITNEVLRVLYKLAALPMGLILISHCAEKDIETRTGTIVRQAPSFSQGVYGGKTSESFHTHVTGLMDAILYATVEKDKNGHQQRVVRSAPSKDYEAGDRTGLFLDGMLLSDLFKGGK